MAYYLYKVLLCGAGIIPSLSNILIASTPEVM